jgi:chromosome segregation protein
MGSIREDLARSQAQQEMLSHKLQGLEEKVSFLAGAFERLGAEKEALAKSIERRRQEMADLSERDKNAKAVAEESKAALSGFGEKLAKLENEAKAIFDKLQALEKQIAGREAKLRELKIVCDEAQAKLHELELTASSQRATQDSLKKRLWDEWQLTLEEAANKYKGQEVDTERIEFLRKRIVALGNVNMAAPEEYLALSEKQVFLANQIEDLKKAKEDLMAAITKINSATRENFRQTFVEVQQHFRRLYGVLFEGGEADLVLTDPENILETGVDIVAQPPGKRLQSISLLSGGEKTLTAIALLFSFFMVKPSPFCMLDEADAALDDANIERFVGLLKEFQSRSQFLIVSHNKRTMEAADVIYGVTMEEMGVSQLVSVDFRKKDNIAAAEAPKKPETHGPFELAGETEQAPA